VELLLFLPLVAFKAAVMCGILWWALRSRGSEDEEDEGDGGLRVDVRIEPRPPWRREPGPRTSRGPRASPARGPRRRTPVR
jgi:hypothetical protein